MKKIGFVFFLLFLAFQARAQVVINEASNRNFTQVTDTSGDNPDWIELYNSGNQPVSLWRYYLSDDPENLLKWAMPDITLPAGKWLLLFASGKGKSDSGINHWETAVRDDDFWRWINPVESTPANWMDPGFDDGGWQRSRGGFGYGDGDDFTEFPMNNVAVYTRITFDVTDLSTIMAATLHMDYDDGFVAYLNGTEIARANMTRVAWNSTADVSREAILYQGHKPEAFDLDINTLKTLLHNGPNTLAIEGHNFTAGQIDMSLRAFLSFGLTGPETQFGPLPLWFSSGTDYQLHTNFKLSSTGETVLLSGPDGNLIDRLVLPAGMPVNSSIGSAADGAEVRAVFLKATPNASNETEIAYTEGFEDAPAISHAGGFYPDPINVVLGSSSAESVIRYTTNGENPSPASERYAGIPLSIRSNTVVKARCFSSGHKLPGPVVTATYFIGQVPTPAGVLSLTMDSLDLYGETGIYYNWWEDWKRQCYIEYFEPGTHQLAFKQFAGIKIDGGAGGSRSLPQRSFRIEPGNGALGDGDVLYPLIPRRTDRKSYSTFYIRNGSNQYLFFPCKDAIETRCMGDSTNNSYSGYTPVQVYLNGKYWGYYELREKLDKDFFSQHEATRDDSLDLLSVSYWYGGTLRAIEGVDPVARFNEDYNKFLSLNAFGESYWDNADRIFDLEYYTDYICAQTFMADTDWPYNNIRIHRSPQTGGRWRFSLTDLEWSLGPNGWSDSNMDHIRFMLDYDPSVPYIHIWQKAMQNSRFHDYFINRFADLLNTRWLPERLSGMANEIYHETRPELPATYARWGEPNISVADYMNQFDAAQQTMLSEFSNRPGQVRNHLKTNFSLPKMVTITLQVEPAGSGTIQISTIRPDTYPWTGIYFDGVPVQIEARPNPGFVFANWDVNALLSDPAKALFQDTLTRTATFRAHFRAQPFSDKLVISEINYNSEPTVDAGDWIEIWNYDKTLTASMNGWYFTDEDSSHVFRFPENLVIRPDERIIVVNNQEKFRLRHPGIPYIAGFTFGLGGGGDAVKLFNHNGAMVSAVVFDDEGPWPPGADGQGRTLELRSELRPGSDPANWFDGCIGGSPGKAYSPCLENVVISEINYNSGSGPDPGDWVELRNIGPGGVDISGWVFKDGIDSTGHAFLIPPGSSLKPGENIVLAQDTVKFRSVNPTIRNFTGPFEFGLNNQGEWVRAYDASGRLRLSVRYNDREPWPVLAAGRGYTLELRDSMAVVNDGTSWMTGCYGGSPGRYFNPGCPGSGMDDRPEFQSVIVYPNPTSDKIHIDAGILPVRLVLKNLLGESIVSLGNAVGPTELSLGSLPAGSYFLTVQWEDGNRRVVRVVRQ